MESEVSQTSTAIYERGVLYLQEPITLPEHAQVRVQILEQVGDQDETRRVQQVLARLKFVTRPYSSTDLEPVTEVELDRIALLYAQGGPLSEVIIAEREGR